MSTDLTGLIPHGWGGGEAVTKWWRGKHLHLYRLRKECAQCGAEMVLDVTKAAILGQAKNAGLHLTRCPKCRAASKAEGPTSRPFTRDEPATVPNATPADSEEQDRLHEQDARAYAMLKLVQSKLPDTTLTNMVEHLGKLFKQADDMYAAYQKVIVEVQPLKAELATLKATYQLQPAMEAVRNKFPWDKK